MPTLRDIVFEDIRSDYNYKGDNSLLYRFFREKKQAEKNNKSKNESQQEEMIVQKDKIAKAALDFMYNHGYSLAKGKSNYVDYATGNLTEKETERRSTNYKEKKTAKSRTSSTVLDLFDAWYLERGDLALGSFKNRVSEKDYQNLFDLLKNDINRKKVLIPVSIDSVTGAGLYIMGKDLFPFDEWTYDRGIFCGLCVVSLWELTQSKGAYLCYEYKDYLTKCTSIADAVKFFENDLGINRVDFLNQIYNFNGNSPESCPNNLKKYFADYDIDEDEDFAKNTEDDRNEAMKDFEMGR